jgi:all-trans-8'-apo-beta-carotenal 15,15'-oxygenase
MDGDGYPTMFVASLTPEPKKLGIHQKRKWTTSIRKPSSKSISRKRIVLSTLPNSVQERTPFSSEKEQAAQRTVEKKGWDRQAWLRGWENLDKELNMEIDLNQLTGKLPDDIRGTLFRNGPAKFRIGSDIVCHPWDGDGMISAITFDENQKIWFRNRFVRTKGYMKEAAAHKILFRGTFGTQIPGGWLKNIFNVKMKNVANTNVLLWNRRLFALWEGGLPYELDPGNLITLGESRLDSSMESFTAHPKIESDTGRLIGFSTQLGLQSSQLTFYEWNDDWKLLNKKKVNVPGFGFYHDFAITPNYYILFQGPVDFTPWKFLLGLCSAAECMTYRKDRPAQIILIPRNSYAPLKQIYVKSGFVFHFANAFESTGETVTIDVVRVPDLFLGGIGEASKNNKSVVEQVDYESQVPKSCLYRYRIDVSNLRCLEEHIVLDRQVEFPIVHPSRIGKRHDIVYLGINDGIDQVSPIQGVAKLNLTSGAVETWIPKPFEFAVEPIFIPRSTATNSQENAGECEEDDGYLITLVLDGKQNSSYYAILDARRVQDGPICTIPLPIAIPHGLHGMWSNQVFSKLEAKNSSTYEIFYSKKWNVFQSDFPLL